MSGFILRVFALTALSEARTRSVGRAIALYRALAGGWPARLPAREAVTAH